MNINWTYFLFWGLFLLSSCKTKIIHKEAIPDRIIAIGAPLSSYTALLMPNDSLETEIIGKWEVNNYKNYRIFERLEKNGEVVARKNYSSVPHNSMLQLNDDGTYYSNAVNINNKTEKYDVKGFWHIKDGVLIIQEDSKGSLPTRFFCHFINNYSVNFIKIYDDEDITSSIKINGDTVHLIKATQFLDEKFNYILTFDVNINGIFYRDIRIFPPQEMKKIK